MRLSTRLWLVAPAAVLATAAACSNASQAVDPPASAVEAPATGLRAFTGAATKVVWVQSDGTDPFAAGDQLILMGLSTEDAKGERVILGKRQSYVKPLLTPRGDRIVFSTRPQDGGPEVFVVDWDGSGLTRLGPRLRARGLGESGRRPEWVYVGTGNKDKSYDFADGVALPDRRSVEEPSSSGTRPS